ncbi:LysE family transporter [Candidatus Bathycorpusculum sp.]|uniref:LysE family transporter n=1 Tax=Candidatus Bathycorpusculum sp. TaxID=2994959 RepID=UPI00282043DC|nr:LysE family translocator [Candidatus Termitimicrobium sp.]
MAYISEFPVFLLSVFLISLSGVLMPGPLFALTIKKAATSKISGALIALGHGIVEFPLMVLIFFVLSQFTIPVMVQIGVGVIGGVLMIFMGVHSFRGRHKQKEIQASLRRDSVFAGIYTTAVNAGFILWWLTVGTALILNAKLFGLLGFSIFAGLHWFIDFAWYAVVAFLIFKSQRFWNDRVRCGITVFCSAVFIGFGFYFMGSALWSLLV